MTEDVIDVLDWLADAFDPTGELDHAVFQCPVEIDYRGERTAGWSFAVWDDGEVALLPASEQEGPSGVFRMASLRIWSDRPYGDLWQGGDIVRAFTPGPHGEDFAKTVYSRFGKFCRCRSVAPLWPEEVAHDD